MRQAFAALAILAFAAPGWADEAEPRALAPGARVRLTGKAPFRLPGVLEVEKGRVLVQGAQVLARDDSRILFHSEGSAFLVPRDGQTVVGRLTAVEADVFLIRIEDPQAPDPVRVPRAAVSDVEVAGGGVAPRERGQGPPARSGGRGRRRSHHLGRVRRERLVLLGRLQRVGGGNPARADRRARRRVDAARALAAGLDRCPGVAVVPTPGQGVAVAVSLRF